MAKPRVRWGILSTAKIAREKLIPALQRSHKNSVVAIASRSPAQAEAFAREHQIEYALGDYQQLLDSPDIDAIYNPLPNHLHVPWTIKAIEAGKHVLCEKPLGLNVANTETLFLVAQRYPQVKVMEAFMYRFHPQWALARKVIEDGKLGNINNIDARFTYYNRDPKNVRNQPGIGGGGLMDIGCYCISASRYLLNSEPQKAFGRLTMDETFDVDCHANALLDFDKARAQIYCSTQSEPSQRVCITGDKGSLVMPYPFYQPENCVAKLELSRDRKLDVIETEPCDHYLLQVNAFADAVMNNTPVPTPLFDALNNMKVIDAIVASDDKAEWINL